MSIYNLLVGGFYGLSSISWRAFASNRSGFNSSAVVTVPASTVAGDLIVVVTTCWNSGSISSPVTISGYTTLSPSPAPLYSGYYFHTNYLYKIATASDAGTTLTISNGNYINQVGVTVFKGNIPITSATASTPVFSTSNTTDPAPITITSSAGDTIGCVLSLAFFGTRATSITGISFTPTQDGFDNIFGNQNFLYYKFFNYGVTRQDVVADMPFINNPNTIYGVYFNLK